MIILLLVDVIGATLLAEAYVPLGSPMDAITFDHLINFDHLNYVLKICAHCYQYRIYAISTSQLPGLA